MYHSFFIHSYFDGHLGCFRVLAVVDRSTVFENARWKYYPSPIESPWSKHQKSVNQVWVLSWTPILCHGSVYLRAALIWEGVTPSAASLRGSFPRGPGGPVRLRGAHQGAAARSAPTQPCEVCLTAEWELLSAAWSAIIHILPPLVNVGLIY